jgi:isoquinoline 1-oxidoreductase alpha subunit
MEFARKADGLGGARAVKTFASVGKTRVAAHALLHSFYFPHGRAVAPKTAMRVVSLKSEGRSTMITIEVNGASRQIDIEPDTPLLWVLRDVIGLTGTKFGCGIAQCGACTVHIDGTAMRSCSVPIGTLDGAKIVTIEGLSPRNNHPVQRAWIEEGVPQCGYCQSGQIMAVVTFLKKYSNPTDADIDANITNICRCGTYEPLRRAIHRAADMMKT